jgi:RNA polymerase sigma-70 factor, ECF subfamily
VSSITTQQLIEQTLILRSQLQDEAAFRELLRLYAPRVLRFVQHLLRSAPELADDVAQEIWIRAYHALPRLGDAARFRPWLFRIARDRVFREFRRRKLPVQVLEESHSEMRAGEAEPAFDAEELQRGLETLSPEHREVLVLRYYEDLDYDAIARITGVTLGTIRSRLHYAKCALRRVIL